MKTQNILLNIGIVTAISNLINTCSVSCATRVELSAFGDSLTYISQYDRYVGNILNFKNTKNYGINGSTISNVSTQNPFIYRYKQIDPKSKIIAIDGGYNDCIYYNVKVGNIDDTCDDTFYGALNILCVGIKQNYKNSKIFFITPFYYEDDRNKKLYPYIDAIKSICLRYSLDCMNIFNPSFDFHYERDTYDGIHPTDEFTKNRWAPAIANFIKNHYLKKH